MPIIDFEMGVSDRKDIYGFSLCGAAPHTDSVWRVALWGKEWEQYHVQYTAPPRVPRRRAKRAFGASDVSTWFGNPAKLVFCPFVGAVLCSKNQPRTTKSKLCVPTPPQNQTLRLKTDASQRQQSVAVLVASSQQRGETQLQIPPSQ